MKHAQTNFVPLNIDELMVFKPYIIGGLRGQRVPPDQIEDKYQDVIIHCMRPNFFRSVQGKVDQGIMTPKQFRAYLGRTIVNLLINSYKKNKRDAVTGAISLTVPPGDDYVGGCIDLERLQNASLGEHTSGIPAEVLETDLIRYVADRKPSFLPTLILRLQNYRPAEIARITGKRKETIHYRIKALMALVKTYTEEQKINRPKSTIPPGPTYLVKGENPYPDNSPLGIIFMEVQDFPFKVHQLVSSVKVLQKAGDLRETTPEALAGDFIAEGMKLNVITIAPSGTALILTDEGGASQEVDVPVYRFLSNTDPYGQWEGGSLIFEHLNPQRTFTFEDILSVVAALKDAQIYKTPRTSEEIAKGFLKTAHGYQIIEVSEPKGIKGLVVDFTT